MSAGVCAKQVRRRLVAWFHFFCIGVLTALNAGLLIEGPVCFSRGPTGW